MKKILLLALVSALVPFFAAPICRACAAELKIKMTAGDAEFTAVMEDNPTAHSLIAQLPLSLAFKDFAKTEKIAYPPQKLSAGGRAGTAPIAGDITMYIPWGNIAIFYRDAPKRSSDPNLIHLGKLDSGIETLAGINNDFTMTIELIE